MRRKRALWWELHKLRSNSHPPPSTHHPPQRDTWGQAPFCPLGKGCLWAGGMGTGGTTPTVPEGKELGPRKAVGAAVQHQKHKLGP